MLSYRLTTSNALRRTLAFPHSRTFLSSSFKMAPPTPWTPGQYPPVRRADNVETFRSATQGEVKVPDPYQWLHDPDSEETKEFVKTQGDFTRKYLDQYADRKAYTEELKKNWNYPRCKPLFRFSFCLFR